VQEGSFEDVPPLLEDGSDDDLPVVELRVGEDEKMTTDG
jgi:ubiquitin carboxyl-terminal hydrolase 4/11/15